MCGSQRPSSSALSSSSRATSTAVAGSGPSVPALR